MSEGCGRKIGPYPCCTIITGDCLDMMGDLPDDCLDLVVTDPLFTLPVCTAASRKRIRNLGDFSASSLQMSMVFDALKRIVKPTGRLFIFCDAIFYPVVFAVTYERWVPQLLVWDKGRIGFGADFRKRFELILYLKGETVPPLERSNSKADILAHRPVLSRDRLVESEKPVALIEELLEGVPGDVVGDFFMGSGATAEAAWRLGKHFLGCEINPTTAERARERVARTQPPLFVMQPEQTEMELEP